MNDDDRKRIVLNNLALLKDCDPRPVFACFADLSAVPRGSGNVDKIASFLENFAVEHNLEHERDSTGNVIIRKPGQHTCATQGVILQAHQDMVSVKNPGVDHDFLQDPIEFERQGDRLQARGTTLGADDGIGIALALAVLADQSIAHPPLEALFTVDEETDMKGAKAVPAASLKGGVLINLDAEDLGTAYISSAAGVACVLEIPLRAEQNRVCPVYRKISVSGLLGGHSGVDINKGRGNAYVLLARFLAAAIAKNIACTLHSFEQGEGHGADNAIPDRALAVVGLMSDQEADALSVLAEEWQDKILRNEYRASDNAIRLGVEQAPRPDGSHPALTHPSRDTFLSVVRLLPLGVFRFIQTEDLPETKYKDLLVETSCNLGIAAIAESRASLTLLARGSTATVLSDLTARIADLARMARGSLTVTNRTSGWEMPAALNGVQKLFRQQGLQCLGVHAGLECGCLVDTFLQAGRTLDAVSVGPDLKEVHSTREHLNIPSVKTLWDQLLAVLAELK